MVYNEKLNYLMIFGGRIDVAQTITYTCFNDLYLLCMQRLLWIKVNVFGDVPSPRSGHCAAAINEKLFVFGGVSNAFYCSSDMYVVETEKKIVNELSDKYEKKQQFLMDVENYKAKKGKKIRTLSSSSSKTHSKISQISKNYYD